jgi:hypothetical protein
VNYHNGVVAGRCNATYQSTAIIEYVEVLTVPFIAIDADITFARIGINEDN